MPTNNITNGINALVPFGGGGGSTAPLVPETETAEEEKEVEEKLCSSIAGISVVLTPTGRWP